MGCVQTYTYTYYEYEPQYLDWETFRSEEMFRQSSRTDIEEFGKIYTKDNYLYINEPNVGVHVFDNSDINNPVKKTFLNIIGNVDIAIKGNKLYADSLVDLLVFNISDLSNITLIRRETNSFPYNAYQLEHAQSWIGDASFDKEKGWVTNWLEIKKEVKETYFYPFGGPPVYSTAVPTTVNSSSENSGQGGSFARFSIVDNYLYVLKDTGIAIFEIDSDNIPLYRKEVSLRSINAGEVETLYYHSNALFIGSTLGMYISDITDRANPGPFSQYVHFQACDPVVVQGDYAYVTLRSGTGCNNRSRNELHIVNVTNIYSPVEVAIYNMHNPHGLGVYGDSLFIADGDYGLRWFELTNRGSNVSQITSISIKETYDVIVKSNHLTLVTKNGLYQYDYNLSTKAIREVSRIE